MSCLENDGRVTCTDMYINMQEMYLQQYATFTVMCHLTTGIHSQKCVVRQFRHCANVIECTYTNLDSRAYYSHRLYDIAY
jgi:hypothetical protein